MHIFKNINNWKFQGNHIQIWHTLAGIIWLIYFVLLIDELSNLISTIAKIRTVLLFKCLNYYLVPKPLMNIWSSLLAETKVRLNDLLKFVLFLIFWEYFKIYKYYLLIIDNFRKIHSLKEILTFFKI